MKVVPSNNITSISSSAQDATYIDDNVLTEFPEQVWKSTGTSGTLTARVSAGSTVCVYNHNADTITVTIKTTGGATIEGPTEYDYTAYTYGLDCLWHEYSTLTYAHDVEIAFTDGRANPVYAGVVFIGGRVEFQNPDAGMQMRWVPYARVYNLSCKSSFRVLKNMKRNFFMQAPQPRNSDLYYLWEQVKNFSCNYSVPWLIRDEDKRKFNVYGYMPNFGVAAHVYPENSIYPIEIMER